MRTCAHHPEGYCLGAKSPDQFALLNLKRRKIRDSPPAALSEQHILEIRLRFLTGVLLEGWEMVRNYLPRMKLASPQASLPPTLLLPRVLSGGSLLLHAAGRPRSSEAIPQLPARRTALAGAREPRGEQLEPQKWKLQPGRGCHGGEEATGGKAPGEGPAHPGRGLSPRVPGFQRPSRRRLRTLSGY